MRSGEAAGCKDAAHGSRPQGPDPLTQPSHGGQQPCFIGGDQLEELVSVHKSPLLRLLPIVEGSGHPHVPGKMHVMMVCLRQPDSSCKTFDPHVAVEGWKAGKKQAAPIGNGL